MFHVLGGAGNLACVNRKTQQIVWQRNILEDYDARNIRWGISESVLIDGDRLICTPGGKAATIVALNKQTGEEIWRVRYAGGYSVVPRPVFAHGLVFVCSGYDSPTLYAIRPNGVGDVTDTHVAWSTNRGVPHNPSVLVAGGELYMVSDSGVATCLDAKTGKNHWTRRLGGDYSASPLLANNVIYFQEENGTAHVIEAGRRFKLLATNKLKNISGERTFASYAVGDGALFLRSEKHLLRIESQCVSQDFNASIAPLNKINAASHRTKVNAFGRRANLQIIDIRPQCLLKQPPGSFAIPPR